MRAALACQIAHVETSWKIGSNPNNDLEFFLAIQTLLPVLVWKRRHARGKNEWNSVVVYMGKRARVPRV
jgi:hypothetical protein